MCSNTFYIHTPVNGSTTTLSPEISGIAASNVQLYISIDHQPLEPVPIRMDLTWSYIPSPPLVPGVHTAEISAIVPCCATPCAVGSCYSASLCFLAADTETTRAPTLLFPEEGAYLDTRTPTLSGMGRPGDTIQVSVGGNLYTTTVRSDGYWELTVNRALSPGDQVLSVSELDPDGNPGPEVKVDVTIATLEPPLVTEPSPGSHVGVHPVLKGEALPRATVYVSFENQDSASGRSAEGVKLYTTTADSLGIWQLTPAEPLAEGITAIEASQSNAAGNVSPPRTLWLQVSGAPEAPVFIYPENGGTTLYPEPVVKGTGTSGYILRVTHQEESHETAVLDNNTWSLRWPTPLEEGSNSFSAVQIDAYGNESTEAVVQFTLIRPLNAPEITYPLEGESVGPGELLVLGTGTPGMDLFARIDDSSWTFNGYVDEDGDLLLALYLGGVSAGLHTLTVKQIDSDLNEGPETVVHFLIQVIPAVIVEHPVDGEVFTRNPPVFSGKGEDGMEIQMLIDEKTLYTASVKNGVWELRLPGSLAYGPHRVRIYQKDIRTGVVGPIQEIAFFMQGYSILPPLVITPEQDTVLYNPFVTLKGMGTPGYSVSLTVDNALHATAKVNDTGVWTYVLGAPLSDGGHTLMVYQFDGLGILSETVTQTFTLRSAAPPLIRSPRSKEQVLTSSPFISGQANAPGTVHLQMGSQRFQAPVQGDGTWQAQVTLVSGAHSLSAALETPDGFMTTSSTSEFTIGSLAPPDAVHPGNGEVLAESPATLWGLATPHFKVNALVDNMAFPNISVAEDGTWSFSGPWLAAGLHTLQLTQTGAGETSGSSFSTFTVL